MSSNNKNGGENSDSYYSSFENTSGENVNGINENSNVNNLDYVNTSGENNSNNGISPPKSNNSNDLGEGEGEANVNVNNNTSAISYVSTSEENAISPPTSALEEDTGAQVLAATEPEDEADGKLFLGDFIRIETPERTLEGILYYVTEDLIRVIPTGASDRLIDIIPAELETMDITDFVHNPGPRTSFVNLYSLRPGLTLLTTKADGTQVGEYKVVKVNRLQDSAIIEDTTGAQKDLQFDYTGIPRDTEFDVLRVKSYEPEESAAVAPIIANNQEASLNDSNKISVEEEYEEEETYGRVIALKAFKDEPPPRIVKYREIKTSEMIYPEAVQKNDLLSNLLEMFEPAQRLNPVLVRKVRSLVEVLSTLKNDIISRNVDGTIEGEKRNIVRTLEELFEGNNVPLSIPVVQADRQVFVDKVGGEKEGEDELINFVEGVSIQDFSESILQLMTDSMSAHYDSYPINDNPDYPRWYDYQRNVVQNQGAGFIFKNEGGQQPYEFQDSKEFFRDVPGTEIGGLNQGWPFNKKNLLTDKYITEDIKFSIGRAQGPSYRINGRGERVKTMPGTQTTVEGYVLFPPGSAAYMGAKRTGKLFYDVARGRGGVLTMEKIIEDTDGIVKVGEGDSSTDIQRVLYFDKDGSRLGQFSFDDFLEIIVKVLTPLGPGDLNSYRADYGIENYEFTQEQMGIIDERIRTVIAAVRSRISELRAIPKPAPGTNNPLLPEAGFYNRLKELTANHPYIAEHISNFESIMPHYRDNDVALLAYLLTVAQDYTMAVLGGVETVVEREKTRYRLVKRMKEREQVYRERGLAELRTEPAVENPCPHVKELAAVRLVKDDDARMALLVQFMNIYQGKRADNWYMCNVCDKHLLCHHEYLQIQQFLHPREKTVLEKQLRLAYTKKGAYNGAYICTNCGIPVRDLEFDTHLELDDNGNPLMGRSAIDPGLVLDEDDELKKQLGLKDDEGHEENLDLKDPLKKEIYDVERQILGKLGIRFDKKSEKIVVNRVYALMTNSPRVKTLMKTKEEYEATIRKLKKQDPKAVFQTYEGFRATKLVSYVAVFIIVEMQTHIPNYYPLYTEPGCTAGFDGYPLDPVEGEPTSENVGLFIPYMACCMLSLLRERHPWNLTSWAQERKTEDRKNGIITDLIRGVKVALKEAGIVSHLEKKRAYVEKTFGRRTIGERPSESIPTHFLPAMMFQDEEKMVAAENPQQMAVVTRNNANRHSYNSTAAYVQSVGWINSAHAQARATVLKDSNPRAETGSCFGTYAVPGSYEKEHAADYPELPPRLSPSAVYKVRSIFGVPYVSQPILDIDIHLEMKYAWEVYMRICYQGDRKGMPHELGWHALPTDSTKPQEFAHKCDWCGLIVPTEYAYPDIDAKGNPILDVAAVKQALVNQGIAVDSEENFLDLINTAHKTMIFNPYSVTPVARDAVFQQLPALAPPPFDPQARDDAEEGAEPLTWTRIMDEVRTIVDTDSARTEFDFLQQISPFASQADTLRTGLYDLYAGRVYAGMNREKLFQAFDTQLLAGTAHDVLERIRTYFLLPLQRIVNGNYDGVQEIMAHKKEHKSFQDVDEKLLKTLADKKQWKNFLPMELLTDKTCKPLLESYLSRVGAYISLGLELNESRIPYRETLMKVLLKILFYGPVYELAKAATGAYRIPLLNTFISLTRIFTIENRTYELSEIREIKAQLKEKEQRSFIDIFDRLSDEQKRLEVMAKSLGIKSVISGKDWSVGGTKKVYQYDPDFWNVQQREFGRNETDYGDASGYDVAQHGDDD
jgi:hypothetical protein